MRRRASFDDRRILTGVASSAVRRTIIGCSEEGRPLEAWVRPGAKGQPRVLVVAGQHGDEPLAMQGAQGLVDDPGRAPDGLHVAVVPCLNPDGRAQQARLNARGLDLNRDHLLLRSREARALHRFVRRWRPHLVLDVHTYPPRRRRLLKHGLVYCHDVFLDVPTTPGRGFCEPEPLQMLEELERRLGVEGFRADRYTLLSGRGRVRHSTPDVCDLRNGLALRYGVGTLLIEGRQPGRREGPAAAERTREALGAALRSAMAWAEAHAGTPSAPPPLLRPGEQVPIRSRYRKADGPRRMPFADESGAVRAVELPGRYTPHLQVTEAAALPSAYAVPTEHRPLLRLLRRHGLESYEAVVEGGERWRIEHVEHSRRPGRAPRRLEVQPLPAPPTPCHVFPTAQQGGAALAVWLEPRSKYGVHRFPSLGLRLAVGTGYPVLRVPAAESADAGRPCSFRNRCA